MKFLLIVLHTCYIILRLMSSCLGVCCGPCPTTNVVTFFIMCRLHAVPLRACFLFCRSFHCVVRSFQVAILTTSWYLVDSAAGFFRIAIKCQGSLICGCSFLVELEPRKELGLSADLRHTAQVLIAPFYGIQSRGVLPRMQLTTPGAGPSRVRGLPSHVLAAPKTRVGTICEDWNKQAGSDKEVLLLFMSSCKKKTFIAALYRLAIRDWAYLFQYFFSWKCNNIHINCHTIDRRSQGRCLFNSSDTIPARMGKWNRVQSELKKCQSIWHTIPLQKDQQEEVRVMVPKAQQICGLCSTNQIFPRARS